jgi:hypothetical protein
VLRALSSGRDLQTDRNLQMLVRQETAHGVRLRDVSPKTTRQMRSGLIMDEFAAARVPMLGEPVINDTGLSGMDRGQNLPAPTMQFSEISGQWRACNIRAFV